MNETEIIDGVEKLLPDWFAGQRWFSHSGPLPKTARVVEHQILRDAWPTLFWALVQLDDPVGDEPGPIYQVPIGLRKAEHLGEVLHGNGQALIGTLNVDDSQVVAYDALIDPILGRVLFDVVTDGTHSARSVRPIGAEQSNTSLVFDNRLIVKFFRRLYEGPNPDLEVTRALTDAGYLHVAPVTATWQRGDWDLAVCVPYLWDGTDGWKLALASVRDYLGVESTGSSTSAGAPGKRVEVRAPGEAGGDFGDEARRLGEVTAGLHVALADQFGSEEFELGRLIASLEQGLETVIEEQRPRLAGAIADLRTLDSSQTGRATRVHGDYHLGQTLRSVSGWFIFDFEGEPARPLTERVRAACPLKDVTGMFRSFDYAAAAGLFERVTAEQPNLEGRSYAWGTHNRKNFWEGYHSVPEVHELLPPEGKGRDILLTAFELEKAIYELAYERAYRPTWVPIPQAALRRLLNG